MYDLKKKVQKCLHLVQIVAGLVASRTAMIATIFSSLVKLWVQRSWKDISPVLRNLIDKEVHNLDQVFDFDGTTLCWSKWSQGPVSWRGKQKVQYLRWWCWVQMLQEFKSKACVIYYSANLQALKINVKISLSIISLQERLMAGQIFTYLLDVL